MLIAHRGSSRDAPENTLPAFQLAWKQGADGIEGDFHLTKDGELVCIHDENTKRVADRALVVRLSTLAELRNLDVGTYRGKEFKGTWIPTLAEVFMTVPEWGKIYCEIKCGAESIPKLRDDIKNSGLRKEQIVVISFQKEVIQELKANAPRYKAFWLCDFKPDKCGTRTPSLGRVLNTLSEIGADGLSSNDSIPETFIEAIQKKGYEWHVWTVDDQKTAQRMKALGAKSITTNIPGDMKNHLVDKDP